MGLSPDLEDATQPIQPESHFRGLQFMLESFGHHIRRIVGSDAARNEVHKDATELLEV